MPLLLLLYRYLFFEWLFSDMTRARGPIERRAAWLHNHGQRRWLPTYMRRWTTLGAAGVTLGMISEQVLAPALAACWYSGGCICASILAIVVGIWVLLGRADSP